MARGIKTTPRAPGQSKAQRGSRVVILETRDFPGLINYPKPQQIQRGAASSQLGFITRETWVETAGGYHPLGTEVNTVGKVLGMKTVHKWDGTEITFKATSDGKLTYYDPTNASGAAVNGWTEVGGAGANILAGAAAAGENVYMDEYFSNSGAQLWVSSPSSDLIKVMTGSPISWLSQYKSSSNFKGRIRIIQNAMFLWHYKAGSSISNAVGAATNSVLQRSWIDAQKYTTQTDSAVTLTTVGSSVTGTLTKNSVTNATVFALQFTYTDGAYTETFTDDFLGNLFGSLGGTGTIDYSTGKFKITPNNPISSPVVNCIYEYEDSTDNGIADFTRSATRLAGQGVSWIQTSGGDILGVNPYNGAYYILHQRNAWVITPAADDSSANNQIYRENIGLASERGSVATGDGIFYIDVTNASRPFVGLLEYNPIASQVLPTDISSGILDLSSFIFDQCVAFQGLDFILFFCRTSDSSVNNRCLAYNIKLSSDKRKIFDLVPYYANVASVLAGQVIVGDSLSLNVYKIFDGFDADGAIPNAFWIGNDDDHGIPGLKKTKKLWLEGFIGINQNVDVYVQLDSYLPVKVGAISGQGVYVDLGQAITIGSLQIGVYPIGGPSSEPIGYHYLLQITINSATYKYFTLQFQPTGIGYFSFQMYANYDIRNYMDKLPLKDRNQGRTTPLSGPTAPVGTLAVPYYSYRETPQGAIDGVNLVYTVKGNNISIVLDFAINGEYINTSNYTFNGKTITFTTALPAQLAAIVLADPTQFQILYV